MIFKSKNDKIKCEVCSSSVQDKYSFCPFCGNSLMTELEEEKEEKDFGMLGKFDSESKLKAQPNSLGITDKFMNSMISSLLKNLDSQLKNFDPENAKNIEKEMKNSEIRSLPNGIKIRISGPFPGGHTSQVSNTRKTLEKKSKVINSHQIEKMSSYPRAKARSTVKRLSDKVIYELSIPGIESANDVFVSKTESGYEVKAIGSKKVYVNSLPVDLPLKRYLIQKNKLLVEFNARSEF